MKKLFPGNRAFKMPGVALGRVLTEGKEENLELCKNNQSR